MNDEQRGMVDFWTQPVGPRASASLSTVRDPTLQIAHCLAQKWAAARRIR
ncbi:hypothetical protein [uncultured Salinisphaera sp.]|tara:strand:- start:862 stop:1011 length:150 start_codon:yes stop_codon:yes gene_type:complete